MKLKKESKIRILENFYSLDYTLFGKPATEVNVCCPAFLEEYLSVKGALMSLVVEMYKLIKHSPAVVSEKVDQKQLLKNARQSAIIARENCEKLVTSKKGRIDVKESLRESISKTKRSDVDIEKLVHEKIRSKAFSLAVDNLLIGRAITESKKFDKLNTWNGRILEDAYKILRDNLVECALNILENTIREEEFLSEVNVGKSIKAAKAAWKTSGGFKGLRTVGKSIKDLQGQILNQRGVLGRMAAKGKGVMKSPKYQAELKKYKKMHAQLSQMQKVRTARNVAGAGLAVAGAAGAGYAAGQARKKK